MSEILTDIKNNVMTITLNRPERMNALTSSLFAIIPEMLKEAQNNSEVRVVVFTGSGRGFCSGDDAEDLKNFVKKLDDPSRNVMPGLAGPLPTALFNFDKPTIAMVNGAAMGAGCDLALACDFRVVSKKASFGELYIKRAISPSASAFYLPKLVGLAKTYEILLLGDIFSAEEADKIGLVTKLVEHEKLQEATAELAQKLCNGPIIAQRLTKRVIRKGVTGDLAAVLELVGYARAIGANTKEIEEGVSHFIEKRPPNFREL